MKLIFNIYRLYVNMLTLSTLYQIQKTEEIIDELSQRDERSKRIGRREKYFKTNVRQFPTPKMCEDGATVAATPTFSLAKQCGLVSQGQNGPRFSTEINFTGNPHKIPLMSYLRRNAGDFQNSTDWPSKTDETIETNKMQMSLRTD